MNHYYRHYGTLYSLSLVLELVEQYYDGKKISPCCPLWIFMKPAMWV